MSDFLRFKRLGVAAALLAALAGLGATAPAGAAAAPQAAPVDPADVAFWQSVSASKNPAEYQAYLNAFPHGVFVEVARIRIQDLSGGGTASAASPTASPGGPADPGPVAPALGPVVGKGIITVTPSAVDVGDKLALTFSRFPKPGQFDWIVIVPTGTPDSTSLNASLGGNYISSIPLDVPYQVGPFPPGTYEARWLTTLYNTKGTLQIGARTQFTVNP